MFMKKHIIYFQKKENLIFIQDSILSAHRPQKAQWRQARGLRESEADQIYLKQIEYIIL